jgi:hypothetical protein
MECGSRFERYRVERDMDIGPLPTRLEGLAFLFCFLWPFVAMVLMRRGVRWRVLVPVMLAPLAVCTAVAAFELYGVLSVVESSAARTAAIGNALRTVRAGFLGAGAVAIVALIQRRVASLQK